jgi:hypothetical protein
MRESLGNRAAAVRDYLDKQDDLSADPATLYKYSITAAQWEAVRLLIDKGKGTPADDRRFADLSGVLRALTQQIGLGTCTDKDKGEHGIPGLTWPGGWLPRDASRIIDATWQQAAEGW